MRFADPQACPDCRGALAGDVGCPHCGLDLTSNEVRQLWQLLLQADILLDRANQQPRWLPGTLPPGQSPQAVPPQQPAPAQEPAHVPTPPPPDPYAQPAGAGYPSYPAPPASQQAAPRISPERQWSVGTILLALGALGLIVAGFIFVTRSWGDIGLLGRTLVLIGVTAVIGALGVWVTRRPLRGSAEAVWTVFLGLLTLDFFAARHEGMLGDLDPAWACVVWGAVLLAVGASIAHFARKPIGTDLVAPAVVAGLGIALSGIGVVTAPDDWDLFWRAFAGLVVTGVLGLAARPAKLPIVTITARVVVAGFFAFAYAAAVNQLVEHPALANLVDERSGLPMALMALASAAIAAVVPQVRIPAAALAVLGACGLVIAPSSEAWRPEGSWLAVSVLAAVLAIVAVHGLDDWIRGVRLAAVPVVLGPLLIVAVWATRALETVGESVDASWSDDWDSRLQVRGFENVVNWPMFVVLAAVILIGWFVPQWPELGSLDAHRESITAVLAAVALVDAVVLGEPSVWLAVAVLLLAAAALLTLQARRPGIAVGPTAAALVIVSIAVASASQAVSAAGWLVGALVLAGLSAARGPVPLRQAYAAGATALVMAGVPSAADLTGMSHVATCLIAVAVALAGVATAALLLRDHLGRLPVEVVGAVGLLVALVVDGSSGELAVRWTIAGAVLIALSFVAGDRRWYVWPGIAALVVAYVLLIVDSGFSFVEAYTLPLGAAALGVGVFALRRHDGAGTWLYLGPGLALALLPSVPQALADPTELRALLLGLGALIALGLGVRLGWQAPFVTGTTILTLLVLFNIGPYANAAPRVVLIAAVSAILLGVGITWEDRVRDGRKLIGYVRSMR